MPCIKKLQALSGHMERRLRTDRGGELMVTLVQSSLENHGIVHEPTPAYAPESNGVAERANRTIMERTRALLIDAGSHSNLLLEDILTRLEATEARLNRNRRPEGQALLGSGKSYQLPDFSKPPVNPCPKCKKDVHWGRDCPKFLEFFFCKGTVLWRSAGRKLRF